MGKFYSLLTSVGIYEQNLSLPSYEMDLKLMENALIEGLRFSKDTIRTLGNSGIVKMRSFMRALMEFSSMIEEEDGFILYFSGHQSTSDPDRMYFDAESDHNRYGLQYPRAHPIQTGIKTQYH